MEAFYQHVEATNAVITTHFELFLIKNELKVCGFTLGVIVLLISSYSWTFFYMTKTVNRLILCTCTLFSYFTGFDYFYKYPLN